MDDFSRAILGSNLQVPLASVAKQNVYLDHHLHYDSRSARFASRENPIGQEESSFKKSLKIITIHSQALHSTAHTRRMLPSTPIFMKGFASVTMKTASYGPELWETKRMIIIYRLGASHEILGCMVCNHLFHGYQRSALYSGRTLPISLLWPGLLLHMTCVSMGI